MDKLFIWAFRQKDVMGSGKLHTHCSWDGPLSDSYKKYILYSEFEKQLSIQKKEYEESVKVMQENIERLKKELK